MKKQFKVEVVALRFFSKADSDHFKDAFDASFPRPGHQFVPELPESNLHNHAAFEEAEVAESDLQFDYPMNGDRNSVYVPPQILKHLPQSISDKRLSDISDGTIVTAAKAQQIKSDADLARELQAMEIQSAGGGAPDRKAYESDDEDSLFYQPAFKPAKSPVIPVVDAAPELPKYQAEGVQHVSPSKFHAEGSRRWLITDVKDEVKHVLTELSAVTEIIETQFIDPLDDITVNILDRALTEDLSSQQVDSMIYDRLRALTVQAGGPADMVPEYVKPPQTTLTFGPGKLGISFHKNGKVGSVVPNSQAEKLGVKKGWKIHEVNGGTFSVIRFQKIDTAKSNDITFLTGGDSAVAVSASEIAKPAAAPSKAFESIAYGGVQPINLYEEEVEAADPIPPPAPKAVPPSKPSVNQAEGFAVKRLSDWDVFDVQSWLSSLKLDRYHQAFENFGVDGEVLDSITDGFLTMNLNVNPIHVKKIKRSLETIKAASS